MLQVLHPLPSEPITRAPSLHSTGPSVGACAPKDTQQQLQPPIEPQCRQPAALEPSQSGLWADLAAELRSAPISAHADSTPNDVVHTVADAPVHLPATQSDHHQADDRAQQQTVHRVELCAAQHGNAGKEPATAAAVKPKPPRQTRRKLINAEPPSEAGTSADDSLAADSKKKKNKQSQPKNSIRASAAKGRSKTKAGATGNPLAAAEQVLSAAGDSDTDGQENDSGKGDTSRQAKNAAFKGSGALSLSRRLSSRLLSPQEINVMSKLPLPPMLQRLDKVLFPPVNGMYGFLLRQHIQVSFPLSFAADDTRACDAQGVTVGPSCHTLCEETHFTLLLRDALYCVVHAHVLLCPVFLQPADVQAVLSCKSC